MIKKILVVDDEPILRDFLKEVLSRKNKTVFIAENGQIACDLLRKESFDLIITDMKMPKKSGIEVLKFAKKFDPKILVILITAFGSIEDAVEAMQLGAFHYLIKPFSAEAIETLVKKAEEHTRLLNENAFLKQQIKHPLLVAKSPSMQLLSKNIDKIAKSNASVFIFGESGTGKEVVSKTIHDRSLRSLHPFITVNCAAIAESLIESEFFGHEKGSFTGAHQKRIGRFEMAHKGTLLLDEVTEIPTSLQAKLLRAIQELEIERVGSNSSIKVDVRFIATSNRDMKQAIEEKKFREDLYYRLNVVPIYLPSLRDRKEDILELAQLFLTRFCSDNHKSPKFFSEKAKQKLLDYSWPGNVRELGNIVERAVVMDTDLQIHEKDLYLEKDPFKKRSTFVLQDKSLKEVEKILILQTLKNENNNKVSTAKKLGVTVRTLRNKLKQYLLD